MGNKYCPNCGARVVNEEQDRMVADAIRKLGW